MAARSSLLDPFPSWQAAVAACSGYEDENLIRSIRERNLAEQAAEPIELTDRDMQMFTALLVAIQRINKPDIRVIDFGGELGGFYRTLIALADKAPIAQWTVVETPAMVAAGAQFQSETLTFSTTMPAAKADIIIASGVLQCVENPRRILADFIHNNADYVIISIHPFIPGNRDLVTARPERPNYPLWMFSESSFRDFIRPQYKSVAEWTVPKDDVLPDGTKIRYRGMLLTRSWPAARSPTG